MESVSFLSSGGAYFISTFAIDMFLDHVPYRLMATGGIRMLHAATYATFIPGVYVYVDGNQRRSTPAYKPTHIL
ncbi:hypothetical protein BDR07DRAFT_1439656 [Suillus spraguei]|nr:hypothetical protein BDR07DRAFT_1439656 [Suillus spraguei]